MTTYSINGKSVKATGRYYDGTIKSFQMEDGSVVSHDEAIEAVKSGNTEGFVLHENNVGVPVLSGKREEEGSTNALDTLPVFEQDDNTTPLRLDNSTIVAIKTDENDRIIAFKLEDGRTASFEEALVFLGKGGSSSGLQVHSNSAGVDVISAIRGTTPDNLKALPRF